MIKNYHQIWQLYGETTRIGRYKTLTGRVVHSGTSIMQKLVASGRARPFAQDRAGIPREIFLSELPPASEVELLVLGDAGIKAVDSGQRLPMWIVRPAQAVFITCLYGALYLGVSLLRRML